MENQHRLIKGYGELSQDQIDAMNQFKSWEEKILTEAESLVGLDPRWLRIGITDLQKGFMALGRAIARPDGY